LLGRAAKALALPSLFEEMVIRTRAACHSSTGIDAFLRRCWSEEKLQATIDSAALAADMGGAVEPRLCIGGLHAGDHCGADQGAVLAFDIADKIDTTAFHVPAATTDFLTFRQHHGFARRAFAGIAGIGIHASKEFGSRITFHGSLADPTYDQAFLLAVGIGTYIGAGIAFGRIGGVDHKTSIYPAGRLAIVGNRTSIASRRLCARIGGISCVSGSAGVVTSARIGL
jgi:hypothetical protein